MRYAGKQSTRTTAEPAGDTGATPPPAAPPTSSPAHLEEAVASQGSKVRELKAGKAPKPEIDAAVALLLDLKKQLTISQGAAPSVPVSAAAAPSKKGKNKK